MKDYQTNYERLTPNQKLAVDTIEGPVMVIAGPGTGKTQVLSLRIANILNKTQAKPHNILALTFTESGAINMKRRLFEIIGETAYHVHIFTFHGFANDIISSYPDRFAFTDELEQLSELEKYQIFEKIIEEANLKHLTSFGNKFHYIFEIARRISDLKRESITIDKYKELIQYEENILTEIPKLNRNGNPKKEYTDQENLINKNLELLRLYEAYQNELIKRGRYDFDDMILQVIDKLQNDDTILGNYQEKYQYILVDEYQDTNNSQNKIIEILASFWEDPNLFVVGDDDQSIFRFQGANLENLLYFDKKYTNLKKIVLEDNFRSSQTVLDASMSLINANTNRLVNKLPDLSKNLKSRIQKQENKVNICEFNSGEGENNFLVQKILELKESGHDLNEIAIIYRENRDAEDIMKILAQYEIPYKLIASLDVLTDINVIKFLAILETCINPYDDESIFDVIRFDEFGIDIVDIYKIVKLASTAEVPIWNILIDTDILETNKIDPANIKDFINKISNISKFDANHRFIETFERIFMDFGILDNIMKSENHPELLSKFKSLFDFAKNLNRLDPELNITKFLEKVRLMKDYRIKLTRENLRIEAESVNLMTAHKSKGLEFNTVFITRCIDKKWGNQKDRSLIKLPSAIFGTQVTKDEKKVNNNEEERRLFYVAMTRTKENLFITYSKSYINSQNETKEALPSLFISEIDSMHTNMLDTKKYEKDLTEHFVKLLSGTKNKSQKLQDFLKSLVMDFKLSPTALKNYIDCPNKFLLQNLLQIPRAKSLNLSLGSAVHKALEKANTVFMDSGALPSIDVLIASFEKALIKESIKKSDMEKIKEEGIDIIKTYYEDHKDTWVKPFQVEYFFGRRNVFYDGIPLTGKLDKVEMIDPKLMTVRVIDYKTGTPKSRAVITGENGDDPDYYRQLVFYKLLFEMSPNFQYNVVEGVLDFVGSTSKTAKPKQELFELSKHDTDLLKEIIKKTWNGITNLEFDCTCDGEKCQDLLSKSEDLKNFDD